jgi:hypothetical protein
MRTPKLLLELLLVTIAGHGLAPEVLNPWRGWVVFKEYARSVAEDPDPGVSVQITPNNSDDTVSLVFLRQVVEPLDDWLHPTGGVVVEFTLPGSVKRLAEWDAWSFDSPDFDRFVDLVEGSEAFQDLIVKRPLSSSVYWIET